MRFRACLLAVTLCSAIFAARTADAEPFFVTLSGPAEYNLGAPVSGFGGMLFAGIGGPQAGAPGMVDIVVDGTFLKSVQAEIDGEYRFSLSAINDNGPHTVQTFVARGTLFETSSTLLTIRSAAKLTMSPTGLVDFGTAIAGTAPIDRTFTVTNIGAGQSGPLQIDLSAFAEFSTIGCQGIKIAGGGACTFTARFTPRVASQTAKQSVLNVTASPGGNVKATLRASATGLLLSPSGVGFADTAPGQVSLPRVVTITNTAAVTSSAIAVTAGGGNPSAFPITDDTCAGASLAPGAQCGFTVRFAPTAEGFMSALVSFSATTGGYPILSLAGTGLGARIDILPTGTEYGKVGPGTTKDKSMNVVNSGLVTSGPLSIALGGPDMAQFSVVADACTGVSLAPNQSCGLTIRFSPASSGVKTAHVTASATPGGSFNAWLKGEGAFA